jgi:hypothetical protein
MKRTAAVLVAGLLAVTTVTGCGGSSSNSSKTHTSGPSSSTGTSSSSGHTTTGGSAAYCSALTSAQGRLKGLTLANPSNFAKAVAVVKDVASKAPAKLNAAWNVLINFLEHPRTMTAADARKLRASGTALAKDARSRCRAGLSLGP